ncbi:MAG: SHOCT domain-containing protein [Alphaproteobacteria bacterium]|nr:SHOCT domain-containing protein [Alphaproteobacteria bacterium]
MHNTGTHMGGDGWFWSMGHFGFWGLIILLLIIGGVFLYRTNSVARNENDPALIALGTRYAAGDIDRDEYLKKKADLKG